MSDDFNESAALHRGKQLWAQRQQAAAHLAAAEANGDVEYAGELIQEIADIDARGENLNRLHQSYVSQRNPAPREPQTDQEWLSKAPNRMDYGDVHRMAAKSKYGVDIEQFKAGVAEVQRRRARGE